jgi:ADP-glucose pyrophosphorylase
VLSQAEGLQILPEGVHAHSVSHLREEVVAGLGDGLRHIDETVVAAGAVVQRALVADNVKIGQDAVVGSADSENIELVSKRVKGVE